MGYDSHSPSSSGYFEPSSSAGTHAFAGYHHHHHHHHQQQQQQQQQRHQQATRAPLAVSTSALASVAAISNTNNGGIFINSNNSAVPASSSTGSLTQPLDLIGLDGEAFRKFDKCFLPKFWVSQCVYFPVTKSTIFVK